MKDLTTFLRLCFLLVLFWGGFEVGRMYERRRPKPVSTAESKTFYTEDKATNAWNRRSK